MVFEGVREGGRVGMFDCFGFEGGGRKTEFLHMVLVIQLDDLGL